MRRLLHRLAPILAPVLAAATWLAASGGAAAMDFRLVPYDDGRCAPRCLLVIEAAGEIRLDSAERFAAFVQNSSGRVSSTLIIDSPGGNLGGAVKFGRLLRELKVMTIVGRLGDTATQVANGNCSSACVFLLMGGVRRYVPAGSRIAVHAMADIPGQRDIVGTGTIGPHMSDEEAARLLREYVRSMGVDPRIVSLAQATPHDGIHVMTPAEIARFRLAGQKLPR